MEYNNFDALNFIRIFINSYMRFLFIILFTILFYGCPDPDPDDGDSIDPNPQNCGSIDYYDLYLEGIPIPEEFVFNSEHLNNIDVINQVYTLTTDSSLSSENANSINDAYLFFQENSIANINNWYVMLSAPHSQRMYRYPDGETETHSTELYTGAIAEFMNSQLGVPALCSKYKSDDPNYHDYIPAITETPYFIDGNHQNDVIPFKQKISDYILSSDNNINIVLDLHGFISENYDQSSTIDCGDYDVSTNDASGDIIVGTLCGSSLQSDLGCYIPEIIEHIFYEHGIVDVSIGSGEFQAIVNQTVTKYVINDIDGSSDKLLDALQIEIDDKYRYGVENSVYRIQFINALSETVYVLNKI